MQELSNFTATLNHFVQLFDLQNDLGYKKRGKALETPCTDADAIADECHGTEIDPYFHKDGWNKWESILSELIELSEEWTATGRFERSEKEYTSVLIQSAIPNRGLLIASCESIINEYYAGFDSILETKMEWIKKGHIEKVPGYDKLLNERIEMTPVALNRVRIFLMHQSAIMGLCCRSTQELKWVISRHFAVGDFIRDNELQNRQLAACFHRLEKGDEMTVTMFVELCRVIYEEGKALRRLTPAKVQRLLKCNETQAALLCEVYELLPDSPLV